MLIEAPRRFPSRSATNIAADPIAYRARTHFGVGFEVVGTRADPQVFLKENALLKAVILQPDSGFFSEEFVAPAKRK
jgi:hypothetical protein